MLQVKLSEVLTVVYVLLNVSILNLKSAVNSLVEIWMEGRMLPQHFISEFISDNKQQFSKAAYLGRVYISH